MHAPRRGWVVTLTAGLLLSTALSAGRAADEERQVSPSDQKIYETLRDIINEGADLYNNGDAAGCYRLYEGALRGLRPLVREEWQKAIGDGLAEAERTPRLDQRAFVLRGVIDK